MASVNSEESDIDELVDKEDDLTNQFTKAADHLTNKLLPQGVSEAKLLTLYGYYKQAMEGPCNVPKPTFFDFKGKAKWEAWKQLGSMSKKEASIMYIETIASLDSNFDIYSQRVSNENECWVKVSTMMKNEHKEGNEMTFADLIKDGNVEELGKSITSYEPAKLRNAVDKLDELGLASIHWAADRGHTNIIELLLKNGADVNLQDGDGQTALHYAASCGHLDCVKYLLEKRAKKDILDNDGNDAYAVASNEVKELLINS